MLNHWLWHLPWSLPYLSVCQDTTGCGSLQHGGWISSLGLALLATEVYWLCMLLKDLYISLPVPLTVWCDNIGALALASNPVYHARTKYIEVDYHFIRGKVVNRDVLVKFISTHDQFADIFTKGLTSARFCFLRDKLNVANSHTPFSLRGAVRQYPPSIALITPPTHEDMLLPPSSHKDTISPHMEQINNTWKSLIPKQQISQPKE